VNCCARFATLPSGTTTSRQILKIQLCYKTFQATRVAAN
jgi:hypothetical protein